MSSHKFNIIICILLLTPLRASFIVLAPIIVLWCVKKLKLKIRNAPNGILTIIFALSSAWGLSMGTTTIPNTLLSWWIVYPILLFMFSTSKFEETVKYSFDFIKYSTYILIFVNIASIVYACLFGFYTDVMGVAYGKHFNGQNGLAILDVIFSIYYFNEFFRVMKKRKRELYYALFFFWCFMLCECGLAFICFVFTILILSFSKSKLKYILLSIVLLISGIFLFLKVSSDLDYYMASLNVLIYSQLCEENFRKLIVFINYPKIIEANPINFLLGIGPGGYNSRIAFLMNNDADNLFTMLIGHSNPVYHLQLVQPLWDKSEVDITLFNDGSRNKPFSSLLSILTEYGIIVLFIVVVFFVRTYRSFRKYKIGQQEYPILFISVFLFLQLLSDQWLETNEMFYILLLMKILGVEYKVPV